MTMFHAHRKTFRVVVDIAMFAALLVSIFPAAVYAAIQATYYVDGVNGSDTNTGADAAHAFRTIDKARQVVETVNSTMTGDIDVNIAPGDYYVNSTITFGKLDSGTNGYNVVYQSTGVPGSARFIGGNLIDNTTWAPTTSADVSSDLPSTAVGKVFKVQLPAGTNFNTLYVNGTRARMARTKNYTYDPRFPAADGTSDNQYMRTTAGDQYSINYGSDLSASAIQGMVDAQALGQLNAQFVIWSGYAPGGSDWFQETLPIGNVDTTNNRLTVVKDPNHPELNRTHWTFGPTYRYFLQGNLSFLDAPGEYYYNPATRWLYYYPQSSELNTATGTINVSVVYPMVQQVLYFKGDNKANLSDVPVSNNQVHNIVLNGLTVGDTDFTNSYVFAWNSFDAYGMQMFPPEAAGSTQPSYAEVTDRPQYHVGAITLTDANHITIENSRITNTGMHAIEMFRDNDSITITNSALDNLGMGGVDSDGGYPGIGKYNGNHTITNVLIRDIGQLVGSAPGLTFSSTGHSAASHLEIYNSPRRGILMSAGYNRCGGTCTSSPTSNYDVNYNPMTDMYTIGNHLSDIYVHHCQQDGGEDSAVFGWVLLNRDLVYQHTSPNSYDPGADHYNYLDQFLIDSTGANPSMHDKNTVHGMDFAMNETGVAFSNFKSVNPQSYTMDAYPGMTYTNANYNLFNDTPNNAGVIAFDDSKMDYANIGLTSSFPAQFAIAHPPLTPPSNIYFSEDFEGSSIDTTNKWIAEKGTPAQSTVYAAEPIAVTPGTSGISPGGKKSFAVDTTANPNGVLLSRKFATNLNKIVTMQFFDKRIDYAYSDHDANHLPNSWGRVDDGVTQEAIGADGQKTFDYYVIKSGATESITNVPRAYGWHEFKWDYTSGTNVKMYIDGTLVATNPAASFNYVSMGDPTGAGGVTYFDDLYIFGGAAAPPPGNAVQPIPMDGSLTATNYESTSGVPVGDAPAPEGGKYAGPLNIGDYLEYLVNVPTPGTYSLGYRVAVGSGSTGGVNFLVDGTLVRTTTLPSTGGLQNWTTVPDSVYLPSGLHTVRLQATAGGWNFKSAQLSVGLNVAPMAQATASTIYNSQYAAQNVTDGIIGQNGYGEWAVSGTDSAPTIRLTWSQPQTIDKIVLYDRVNQTDWVLGGTLKFDDGSTISVPYLPNNGTKRVITFAHKTVQWVEFDITNHLGLAGLSEFQVYYVRELAKLAMPSASSSYTPQYGAGNLIDGGGLAAGNEWAASATDVNPWVRLTWSSSQNVDEVVLFDRINTTDNVMAGTLKFSDGSTVAVPALNKYGAPVVITFPSRSVTWIEFDITTWTGLAGLGEFAAYSDYIDAADPNLATSATIVTSSQYTPYYAGSNVADGIIGQWGTGEWAVAGSDTAPSISLTWAYPQKMDEIVLYDRVNLTDQITGGTLKFDDGTSVTVSALYNDGSPLKVPFPEKYVSRVEFDITSWTGLPGLTEMQVYDSNPNLAPGANVTASSQYSAQYPPANVVDGIIGGNGVGEWAVGATDHSPWVKLTWANPQTFSKIVLYDRPNLTDQVLGGTLVFSDGSSYPVPTLNNDGSATSISIPTKTNVTSVQLNITSYTGLPGLSEFQVYAQ